MRLTCPNCDAQYEVDASLIPATGRDVQCSNCGNTWFQHPEGKDGELARDLGRAVPEPEPDLDEDDDEDDEPAAPPAREPARRTADEKALGVLREEAQREMEARKQEAGGLETQPDLGLASGAAATAATVATARSSRLRGEAEDGESTSRRDLLPDIDEINSTLNATSNRPGEEPTADVLAEERKHRSGFRIGFSMIILIFVGLIALYLLADRIAGAVPALEGPLAAYVDWGNGVRLWFDGLLEGSVETLSNLIVSVTGRN